LKLTLKERGQLEAYLRTLDAPVDADAWLLEPPHPSNIKEGGR
jgi:hypothetical protein